MTMMEKNYKTGSGAAFRERQKMLHYITEDTELTERYLGALISNYGATDTVTVQLPAAEMGMVISFIRLTDQTLNVDPQDDEYLVDPRDGSLMAAGELLPIEHLYDVVDFRCTIPGYWMPVGYNSPNINREDAIWVAKSIDDKDDDYTILSTDDGACFTNSGAAKDIILTLPAASAVGMVYEALVAEAGYAITITAPAGQYLKNPVTGAWQGAAKSLSALRLGSHIRLVCIIEDYWQVEIIEGQWQATDTHVVSKTANYALLASDNGGTFDNTGDADAIVYTLPAGLPGMRYSFVVTVAQEFSIDTPGTDYMQNPLTGSFMAVGKYIKASRIGSRITLVCNVAGYWHIESMTGEWLPETTHVVSKTADYSLTIADNGGTFDNTGDTGAIVFTLPTGVVGLRYTFIVAAAQNFTIDAPALNYLQNPITGAWQAAAKYIRSSVVGSRITVVCDTALYWQVENVIGPWIGEDSILTADADGGNLEVTDSGKTYTNAGAVGAATFVLPAAVVGLKFNFFVQAAQELRIDPDGTETIALPSTGVQGAAGKYLTANAIGEWVNLECLIAGQWEARGYGGTWTEG